jgi:hypothetical protein
MRTFARFLVSSLLLCTAVSGTALAQKVDKVTAGGFITGTPSAARGNFGLNVRDTAAPSGHLNYVDHGIGIHVSSTAITTYTIVNATTRTFTGTCTIDGVAGFTFTCTVVDVGEPGTSDTFSLSLSSGYAASGTLVGGNVQVHPVP